MAPLLEMKIHSKWYDMTGFDHPGGPVMLELGGGRDATALFEAHHPFTSRTKINAILAKYEMAKPGTLIHESDATEEFVWPEPETMDGTKSELAPVSAFAQELRLKVITYFKGEAARRNVPLLDAIKATPARWLEMGIMFALMAATLPSFFAGQYWTLVATPLTYWVWGVNMFHDGSHFAISRNWRINLAGTYIGVYFSSPFEWYHQHVIGHHAYPNIPHRDPDLYHNGSSERHTSTLRWRPAHKYQAVTWYLIWAIGTFAMNYLKPIQLYVTGYYNRSVAMIQSSPTRLLQHLLGRILVFCLCHVWPFFVFPRMQAILFAVIPVVIVSCSFMACSQVNHLTAPNVDVRSSDYYKHQVLTSHTFGDRSYLTFLFTGGLNFQIEHHLFPTVNHCHLHKIQPMVKALCLKHGINYHDTETFRGAISKYVAHLRELSVPTESHVRVVN